jgi:dihydroorotase
MNVIEIDFPDDFHHHFRDGAVLNDVVRFASHSFERAIVMPNLKPPVRTVEEALSYWDRILSCVQPGHTFTPLMTLYLTDNTTTAEINRAKESGVIFGVKYYPAGATTNSEFGVTSVDRVHDVLKVAILLII